MKIIRIVPELPRISLRAWCSLFMSCLCNYVCRVRSVSYVIGDSIWKHVDGKAEARTIVIVGVPERRLQCCVRSIAREIHRVLDVQSEWPSLDFQSFQAVQVVTASNFNILFDNILLAAALSPGYFSFFLYFTQIRSALLV